MNRRRLLFRLSQGHLKNVAFSDIISLAEGFGFRFSRRGGSHHIYVHPEVPELVNLQDVRGEAKPYQIRQLLRLVERYDLRLEDQP
ncbi:MAG TPA: type II toxin-antitoxin system HicA family toxin [Planctomycetota bacterium]|nr:type II toxin-antitoxin system HicA family toxin [Planctomycetota bacterium]